MNVNVVLGEEILVNPELLRFDRTQVSAACMDSCITWPICPVMVKPPLPFMVLASTNSTSPPEGVQARPNHTPARLVRSAISPSLADLDPAQKFLNDFLGDNELVGLAFGLAARLLAANGADVALQVAHARFPRVVPDDVAHSTPREIRFVPR